MPPGGRGYRSGSRGRSRGGVRGGRFRGRGGPQQRRGPRFDSARVKTKEDKPEEQSQDDQESELEVVTDHDNASSDEDTEDEVVSNSRPYLDLIRSFAESAPNPKRRKVHAGAPEQMHEEEIHEIGPEADEDSPELSDVSGESLARADSEELFDHDDDLDSLDPFETHFAAPDASIDVRLQAIQENQWQQKRMTFTPWKLLVSTPKVADSVEVAPLEPLSKLGDLKLKQRLRDSLASANADPKPDEVERQLAPILFNHRDTLFCERSVGNSEALRRIACLHVLNHIFKTRDRVIKNNSKLSKKDKGEDLELQDQGFTRPKVLILLPTRQSCAKMIEMICTICKPDEQENRKRFEDSFVRKEKEFGLEKPADFRELFEGNDDDMFRLGVKFTRKTIKYFSQFYNSDILIASPLGLRTAIGSEEDKKFDCDYLSSIELVLVDQADALLMQNWEHVEYIFEHLNLQPKAAHDCDFSRVRSWYAHDQAKHFRQTIIFSAFNTPELSKLFRSHCSNWAGKVRVYKEYHGALLSTLGRNTKQTFSRFQTPSIQEDPNSRFEYFTRAVLPALARDAASNRARGTLIFIPSYLDFVRVRNYFASNPAAEKLSFGTLSEYEDVRQASRARSHFLSGGHNVLLYTERAHHFRRHRLKGVRRVIMYGVPDNPVFYEEIAGGFLRDSEHTGKLEPGQGSVRAMFSKYDVLKLERIVGSQRVGRMIHEQGDTFDFL